jgi:hypothetical protein
MMDALSRLIQPASNIDLFFLAQSIYSPPGFRSRLGQHAAKATQIVVQGNRSNVYLYF